MTTNNLFVGKGYHD